MEAVVGTSSNMVGPTLSNNSYAKKNSQLANDRKAVLSKIVKLKRKSSLFLFLNRFGKAISVIGMWGTVLWIVGIYWFVLLFSVFLIPHHFGESAFESMNRFLTTAIALFIIPMAILLFLWLSGSWLASNVAFKLSRVAVEICDLQTEVQNAQNKIREIEKRAFEDEQHRKGLIKFVDRFGKEHWDTPERIEILRQKDFEEQQKAKGLVQYQGEWMTKQQKIEREQLTKGLIKYTDRHKNIQWGTKEQIEKWSQMDFEEEQRAKGLVKYEGKWIPKSEMELLKFKSKTPETLATEMAAYIRRNVSGILLNTRTFNELITRFLTQEYGAALYRRLWDRAIASKVREAEGATLGKYLSLLTEELVQWAQSKNLMKLTKADAKLFLASNNMRLSTALEQMLYREAKLKYRWLPSWMRE